MLYITMFAVSYCNTAITLTSVATKLWNNTCTVHSGFSTAGELIWVYKKHQNSLWLQLRLPSYCWTRATHSWLLTLAKADWKLCCCPAENHWHQLCSVIQDTDKCHECSAESLQPSSEGKVNRLTVKQFTDNWAKVEDCLSPLEKKIYNCFTQIEIRGKWDKNVPLLFTQAATQFPEYCLHLQCASPTVSATPV